MTSDLRVAKLEYSIQKAIVERAHAAHVSDAVLSVHLSAFYAALSRVHILQDAEYKAANDADAFESPARADSPPVHVEHLS